LIVEGAENAKALLDVENNILQILSAPGNILEDENAVDVLDNSKVSSIIVVKLIESIVNITEIYYSHELNVTIIALHKL
jgi:dynein heavy chain